MLWGIERHGAVLGTLGVYWSPLGHWRALESWWCWGLLGALEVLDSTGGTGGFGVYWKHWGVLECYWDRCGVLVCTENTECTAVAGEHCSSSSTGGTRGHWEA